MIPQAVNVLRFRRGTQFTWALVITTALGWHLAPWGVSDAYAQEGHAQKNDELTIPPPSEGNQTLVVKVQVTQPYIDKVATRVTYDGMDRVFGIEWKNGKTRGTLRVLDAWVIDKKVVSDIYDDTNAGISMPARYTPITTPRLFPYLIAVRDKWGKQFDDMAHASAQIATVSLVAATRPVTSALTARAAATPRPSAAAMPCSRPKYASVRAGDTPLNRPRSSGR